MDLSLTTADDGDLSHSCDGFQLTAHLLISGFCQLANGGPFAFDSQVKDGDGARIHFADDRLFDAGGQLTEDGVHLVAHILSSDVDLLVQDKLNDDLRDALT